MNVSKQSVLPCAAILLFYGLSGIGCATNARPLSTEAGEAVAGVTVDNLRDRYSYQPIQRRNNAEAAAARRAR